MLSSETIRIVAVVAHRSVNSMNLNINMSTIMKMITKINKNNTQNSLQINCLLRKLGQLNKSIIRLWKNLIGKLRSSGNVRKV